MASLPSRKLNFFSRAVVESARYPSKPTIENKVPHHYQKASEENQAALNSFQQSTQFYRHQAKLLPVAHVGSGCRRQRADSLEGLAIEGRPEIGS
jgi:hypothetical protein